MVKQHNDQRKKDNDHQNTIQKTKDRATWTPLKIGGELMYSGRVGSPCSICGTCRVILVTNRWWTHVLRTSRQSLIHMWHLCYSCYKPVVNSCAPDELAVSPPYVALVVLFLLQTGGELMCSGRVGSPWSICGTCVILVTNRWWTHVLRRVGSVCSICGTCRVILATNRWWTHVLRTSRQSLIHMWPLSCYSCYKPVVNPCTPDE